MSTAGFETAILASKLLQTYVINRAATGLGQYPGYRYLNLIFSYSN